MEITEKQKDSIAKFIKEHKRWGPFKKFGKSLGGRPISETSFWRLYEYYRKAKISKSGIARILKISRQTLYKRLDDNPKKYQEIENKVKSK